MPYYGNIWYIDAYKNISLPACLISLCKIEDR